MTQIIFNSQEEFEDAVMDVLQKWLSIEVYGKEWTKVKLFDYPLGETPVLIAQDSDGY